MKAKWLKCYFEQVTYISYTFECFGTVQNPESGLSKFLCWSQRAKNTIHSDNANGHFSWLKNLVGFFTIEEKPSRKA